MEQSFGFSVLFMSSNTIYMPDNCTIRLMGDVMIGRSVNRKIIEMGYDFPWGNVLPYLKKPGINIINLEAALTSSEKKVAKVFNFKSEPEHVKTLSNACVQIANIANNHILDYSEEGLLETICVLDRAGILHAGAGKNIREARRPAIIERNGVKIGLLGCTDNESGWKSNQHPGINHVEIGDLSDLKKDIKALRPMVDILILSAHFGPNMVEKPDRDIIEFKRQLIDLGADIIHGHSAHIFQGIEIYQKKLILHDIGDFIDDYYVDPELKNDRSFLFEVYISGKKISGLKLLPVLISNMQVNFADKEVSKWSIARIQYLSESFGTKISDSGEVLGL